MTSASSPRNRWLTRSVEGLVHELTRCNADPFDIVIVGSGYGGAVAAARLAGCHEVGEDGQASKDIRVCVLERGQEYLPGMFPQRFDELAGHVRFGTLADPRPQGSRTGLFDLRLAPDVSVLLASGVGGGSLINAGVMAEPRPEVFDFDWPREIRHAELAQHFTKVRQVLDVQKTTRHTHKLFSLMRLGQALQGSQQDLRCEVAVNFAPPPSAAHAQACLQCGDCFTGCNHGAKNTLDTNYLKMAREQGAEIFTGATVLAVERPAQATRCWDVVFTFTQPQTSRSDRGPFRLRCRRVILAAGSLGSTEILLRSQQQSTFTRTRRPAPRLLTTEEDAVKQTIAPLKFSDRLGHRFSTNGDMFAVAYRQSRPANAVADEEQPPGRRNVGPTITGLIDLRGDGEKPLAQQIVIEEMAVPGALHRVFAEAVTTSATLYAVISERGRTREFATADPLAVDEQAIRNTAFYALMGHDGAAGQLQIAGQADPRDPTDGCVYPRWSDAGACPVYKTQIELLERACRDPVSPRGLCEFVIPSPLWRPLPGSVQKLALGEATGSLLTVHPLGGCPMGNDASDGVTDHVGRVFDAAAAASSPPPVHDGLVVLDGSIIPTSLGINPALTIAAVAERAVQRLKVDWTLRDGGDRKRLPSRPTAAPEEVAARASRPTRVEIREQLSGPIVIGRRPLTAVLQVAFDPFAIPAAISGRHRVQSARLMLFDLPSMRPLDPATRPSKRPLAGATPVGEYELGGHVDLFVPEEKRDFFRTFVAYVYNRSADDLRTGLKKKALRGFDRLRRKPVDRDTDFGGLRGWLKLIGRLCMNTARGWKLVYELDVVNAVSGDDFRPGDRLQGIKLIAYERRSNPWRQLSSIELSGSGPDRGLRKLGTLTLDLDYFARQAHPLLRIVDHENHPRAIADLLSFALYATRMLLGVHLLSFKPQDRRRPKEEGNQLRLFPGALDAAPVPAVVTLTTVTSPHGDVQVRLTRYPGDVSSERVPVLLLHGFGASGSTFAHDLLKPSLVQRLAIEGFDVWVADLRTSVAMPTTAGHQWSLEDVARTDVVAAVDEVLLATGAPQVSVVAHCIGAAMFSYAVLSGRLQGKVRSAVLSQVGPVTKFSAPNRFRAYLASYLANYVQARVFDIRPSAAPGMLETMVDRLLATYPYDDREWEYHNPLLGGRVPEATMRRRADAIWGQLFEHDNVDRQVARKLDEFLGRVNVANLAQTMHYALREALTLEQGIGSALDHGRLQTLWRFPTLFLFGERNRVFDEAGVRESCELLQRLLTEQDGPCSSGREAFDWKVIEDLGHQDVFIGKDADARVFVKHIVPFLNARFAPIVPKPKGPANFEAPRFGPVLGWLRAGNEGRIVCRMTIAPPVAFPASDPRLAATPAGVLSPAIVPDDPGWPQVWEASFPAAAGAIDGSVAYQTTAGATAQKAGQAGSLHLSERVLRAADRGKFEPRDEGLTFAIGSCQYPPGLLDRSPAMASFSRLAARLDSGEARKPQLLLLVGDQIYADETAGMFVSNVADEPFTGFHERLFAEPAVQRVVAQLPTFMMLDDHELWDNWEPPAAGQVRLEQQSRQAALAFQRYQWHGGPGPSYHRHAEQRPGYWYEFFPAGIPFFVMDTRTERDRRVERAPTQPLARTRPTAEAGILSARQWSALEAWLARMHEQARWAPKFIVSPSVVFPWSSAVAEDPASAGQADGWDGYPASLRRLLGLIAERQYENVVFLSGDRHASFVARIDLTCGGRTVTAHSIVSSALYAPYPFVNARPRELALAAQGTWNTDQGTAFHFSVRTLMSGNSTEFHSQDAFAVVHVVRSDPWELVVELDTAAGSVLYPPICFASPRLRRGARRYREATGGAAATTLEARR